MLTDADDVLCDVPRYCLETLEITSSEKLGSGGWGAAFPAKNPKTLPRYAGSSVYHAQVPAGSALCVKVFHAKKQLSQRSILREIRNHALLSEHENIATLYGYGFEDVKKTTFVVMPLYSGGSLESVIRARYDTFDGDVDGPDEEDPWWSEAFIILLSVAEALAHLERKGFVHRDVKPANILLSDDMEQVVLSDFGLATRLDELEAFANKSSAHRARACQLGTPGFVAPELRTVISLPTFKSDVWSFGIVAYACAGISLHIPRDGPYTTSPQWLQSLIWHCTRDNPEERPLASTVVQWLKTRSVPSMAHQSVKMDN